MKIAIYGGSFNPINMGHIKIARDAIKRFDLDKLIFVPANKSPFKKKEIYEKAEDRFNMINLVKEDNMEISKFEINRKGTSYSIDTVKYFKNKYPNDELFMIIGTDQLYKLHKWRQIDEIIALINIVVYKRKGPFSKINIKKYKCSLVDNDLYDYSSTEFRKGDFSHIDERVNEYIGKNHLYINDLLLSMTNPKRHKHCIATGNMAAKYAKLVGYDAKKAWIAGVFHDITKNWTIDQQKAFIKKMDLNPNDYFDHELHSLTGSLWLKNIYKINDNEIVAAVKKHTSLARDITMLDKIIFAADKTAMGRNHPGVQKERQLLKENFEEGFKNLVKNTYESLGKIGRKISKDQANIYEEIYKGEI